MVAKYIGRNGKEPFFKRAGGESEGANPGDKFQKQRTEQVVTLGGVAGQPIKVAVTTTCVQINQPGKRLIAAGLTGGNYLF